MSIKNQLTICFIFFISLSFAQPKVKLDTFARGFVSPIDIANDGFTSRIFAAQQNGIILTLDSTGTLLDTFINLRDLVLGGGDQGLLGLAFHPDYKNNGYFYTYFTQDTTTDNAVFRYKVSSDPNIADRDSEMLVINLIHPFNSNHNGGCIRFGRDGYLYIAVGDGNLGNNTNNVAQDRNSYLGKLLRLDVNNFSLPYTIPASNPFFGQANVKQEIWAYGLRNPWRFSFDKDTGDLWLADVGEGTSEEVNFQAENSSGGENYGWRCYEGNNIFNTSGCSNISNYTFPVFEYNHGTNGGVAVTGGFVYRGNKYNDLKGYYICGDYTSNNFWAIKKNGNTFTSIALGKPLTSLFLSAFGEDIRGELYASDIVNGVIYKIRELCSAFQINLVNMQNPSCTNVLGGSIEITSVGTNENVSYNWSNGNNGNLISNLAQNKYTVIATNDIGCTRKDSFELVNLDTLEKPIIIANGTLLSTDTGFLYQWKDNGIDILNAIKDTLRITASGNYQVEIKDANGCKAISDTVRFIFTSIKNKNSDVEKFSLFPNPATDNLIMDIRFNATKKSTLRIINPIGQLVYSEQFQGKQFLKTIPIQQFSKGIYQLFITSDDGQVSSKIFVKE